MTEPFAPERAIAYLKERLTEDGKPSAKMAAFITPGGRQLAVTRDIATTQVWLEATPPDLEGLRIVRGYAPEDRRHSNLHDERGSRLGNGHKALRVEVENEQALAALLVWYKQVAPPGPSDSALCLIGTVSDYDADWAARVSAFIEAHGGWASKWSFPFKREAHSLMSPPFWIYFNETPNSIPARALVEEVVTGDGPSQTPWPALTEARWLGETREGPKNSRIFRTWLRLSRLEFLPTALRQEDFIPEPGLSNPGGLLNQGAFGYARRKTTAPLRPQQESPTMTAASSVPLNTILYGPPGTSKTYETIERAVRIIDPEFVAEASGDRLALKARFDALMREGRVEFVTFHQSYSYEDFVQGIRASTDNGAISYRVEDGVFKRLCLRATTRGGDDAFIAALESFKQAIADEPATLKTRTGRLFTVTWRDGKTLRLRPHSSTQDADYPASLDHILGAYRGEDETTMYNLSYVRAVMSHVKQHWNVPGYAPSSDQKPYVLIIDEINRGNIASIFGELITLIEPSKRKGRGETLQATLAYTSEGGAHFAVPDNLHLIGTMNTADRSLARVDTALRRRFDFIPMYPQADKLDGVLVEGVDLGQLLRRMNERIEILFDRDHQLGHAYFIHMKEDLKQRTIDELAKVFRNRILPLLEEYFFEDWKKIRWVLADNQKSNTDLQFVIEEDLSAAGQLFGDAEIGLGTLRYRVQDEALKHAASYRQVYEHA